MVYEISKHVLPTAPSPTTTHLLRVSCAERLAVLLNSLDRCDNHSVFVSQMGSGVEIANTSRLGRSENGKA